ncbi:MAG: hypothetical protein N2249_08280 [Melioribacter sp.]|nr:hypothetical protein [Melioribacter sp.]
MNKNLFKIILLLIVIVSCKEPAPVELTNNFSEKGWQVNPISNDVDANLNVSGFDSTGITNPFINKSTVITITGVRNTNFGNVQSEGYYYATFNDKSKPVKVKNGKLIGFKTKSYLSVKFNNYEAIRVPNIVKYMDKGVIKDTVLGIKYFAKQRMMGHLGQMQGFPFSSKVSLIVSESKNSYVQLEIATPAEIVGKISFEENSKKNFTLILDWNAQKDDNVEIILSKSRELSDSIEPLIKISGNEKGKVKIPLSIIEDILRGPRKIIVISFIRKIVKEINNNLLNDTYIVAQSIHNIRVEIP